MSIDKEELHRRMMLLREAFESGKIKIAEHLADGMKESLSNVKFGKDGLIDPDSVDGRIRSMALMIASMKDREDMKSSVSLRDIQYAYFEFIEANFGPFIKMMKDHDLNPHQLALGYSKDPARAADLVSSIPDFLDGVKEFWADASEIARVHLQDSNSLKSVFGGDLFPSYQNNIASSIGLYVDTVILPDPFLRSFNMFQIWSDEDKAYYLLKLALNVLSYRQLALAQVDPPIVAILPDRFGHDEQHSEFISELGQLDAIKHSSSIFGRDFESMDEINDFVKDFETAEKLISQMKKPDRLLFDTEWETSKEEQLKRAYSEYHNKLLPNFHAGQLAVLNSYSRMSQANDIIMKSRSLGGDPIVDAPTSWKYLSWKYEYDSDNESKSLSKQLFLTKGLQDAATGEMKWLGKIPPKKLVELRRSGEMDEIRNLISGGIKKIEEIDPKDFENASQTVISEIQNAFADHNSKIEDLEKSKKDLYIGAGKWVAIGALEVTAIANGVPAYGLLAFAANQITDVPKLKDIPKKIRELKSNEKEVTSSPAAIFINIKNEAEDEG